MFQQYFHPHRWVSLLLFTQRRQVKPAWRKLKNKKKIVLRLKWSPSFKSISSRSHFSSQQKSISKWTVNSRVKDVIFYECFSPVLRNCAERRRKRWVINCFLQLLSGVMLFNYFRSVTVELFKQKIYEFLVIQVKRFELLNAKRTFAKLDESFHKMRNDFWGWICNW